MVPESTPVRSVRAAAELCREQWQRCARVQARMPAVKNNRRIHAATVVVALGISAPGEKVPLGLWLSSTENATMCTALVQDLPPRGLRVEERLR